MLGIEDPFAMLNRMSRRVFIYWTEYMDLVETKYYEKWEYYLAQLNADLLAVNGVSGISLQDKLISFEAKDPEQAKHDAELKAIQEEQAFFAGMNIATKAGEGNKRKRK